MTEPHGNPHRLLRVDQKFAIALASAFCFLFLTVLLSLPWLRELSNSITLIPALVVILLIAYVPSHLMSFFVVSLVLDHQPPLKDEVPDVPVTIIVAALNEENRIAETLTSVAAQDYAGPIHVLLADNGSTDRTCEAARNLAAELGLDLVVIEEPRRGKTNALNTALNHVRTPLVITLDADTMPHPQAVRRIITRLDSAPADVVAVAGALLASNPFQSIWTKAQQWDYLLAIASIKRMQGLYQSTLVAQGAFSLYRTDAVVAAKGWPDAIGEDIVLTWRLLASGGTAIYEPTAIAYTVVPRTLKHLVRQRERWARGMIEGLQTVQPWKQVRGITRAITSIDLAIPWLDLGYSIFWVPGLILAAFGVFWIVGLWTLLVLPITIAINLGIFWWQRRHVVRPLGLEIRYSWLGFAAYLIIYQLILSPAALLGYVQQLFRARRVWE